MCTNDLQRTRVEVYVMILGGPSPVTIVQHALERAVTTGISRTRRCIKFLPVAYSTSANMENILKMAKLTAPEVGESGMVPII